MYRVAVILNESELLRSGYANVVPKWRRLTGLNSYEFTAYTVANIGSLFGSGNASLHGYDSLIITTNATSDRVMLQTLRQNTRHLVEFLGSGKGLFVSSQKKLSCEMSRAQDGTLRGLTQFLPEQYDFCTVERPQKEADSGIGRVFNQSNAEDHIILSYPHKVDAANVEQICSENEFRRHFYRSHLEPVIPGSYVPLLVDTSYPAPHTRVLMMADQAAHRGERVVISTIVLDWENHEALLVNIIRYVTEGVPRIAFISHPECRDPDYEFVLSSARLSKMSHIVYPSISAIPMHMRLIHNSYILSPGWDGTVARSFIKETSGMRDKDNSRMPFAKVFQFERSDGVLGLLEYSNYSTIDLMVKQSAAWLKSQFDGGMWGGSFWITHDVLAMMLANRIDCEYALQPVFIDIQKHIRDGSYDGIMGSTCGLLSLLVRLNECYPKTCRSHGFSDEAILKTCHWVALHAPKQSVADKRTAVLTILRLSTSRLGMRLRDVMQTNGVMERLSEECRADIEGLDLQSEHLTEVGICSILSDCILRPHPDRTAIRQQLSELARRQSTTGQWTNVGRTAHVMVLMLEHWDVLHDVCATPEERKTCDEMFANAVLFLRSKYGWTSATWETDLQATAKAAHAIGIYNHRCRYATQDFLQTVQRETAYLTSANLVESLGEKISGLRQDLGHAKAASVCSEFNRLIQSRRTRFEALWRHVAFSALTLLAGLVVFLLLKHRAVIIEVVEQIGVVSLVAGLILGVIAGWWSNRVATHVSAANEYLNKDVPKNKKRE